MIKQLQDFPRTFQKNLDDSLNWDIHDIDNKKEAFSFCKHFEPYLPVYSSYLNKIYGEYDLMYNGEDEMITVIPNLEGLLHVFDHIQKNCVEKTFYSIMPGSVMNKKGIIVFDTLNRKTFPLKSGLSHIMQETCEEKSEIFSPLLKRDSLHNFGEGESFVIDICRINYLELQKSPKISQFEFSGLKNYFHNKFINFCYHSEEIEKIKETTKNYL